MQKLWTENSDDRGGSDKWDGIKRLLECGCLGPDAIRKGLLDGENSSSRGIMPVLAAMLGTEAGSR
jgi:hypothetical protein